MTEPDWYDERIATLKTEIFDIGGRVAMLSPGNHEGRAYWYRAADEADRELRTLIEHADELRGLDVEILYVSDAINAEQRQLDRRAEGWSTVTRGAGVLGGLLLLTSAIGTVGWLFVVGLLLVTACMLARSRSMRVRREASSVILDQGRVMRDLEIQRDAILAGRQSPSASTADSAPERSFTHSQAVPRVPPAPLS